MTTSITVSNSSMERTRIESRLAVVCAGLSLAAVLLALVLTDPLDLKRSSMAVQNQEVRRMQQESLTQSVLTTLQAANLLVNQTNSSLPAGEDVGGSTKTFGAAFEFGMSTSTPALFDLFLWSLWLVALMVWMDLAADAFLCPCLSVVAEICQMSEHAAGVTLLALGNGAPDIFSQIQAALSSNTGGEMAVAEFIGAASMVSGFVLGCVALNYSFSVLSFEFTRDLAFLLVAVLWLLFIVLDNQISLLDSAGFLLLYLLYLSAVFWGDTFLQRAFGKRCADSTDYQSPSDIEAEEHLRNGGGQELGAEGEGDSQEKTLPPAIGLWTYVYPFQDIEMAGMPMWSVVLALIRAPGKIILRLSCPVVDVDAEGLGWCKPAVLIQTVIFPVLLTWSVIWQGDIDINSWDACLFYSAALFVGALAALAVHATSRREAPPKYFKFYYSVAGFLSSINWISIIAAEAIYALQAIGVALGISQTILGLTVLAFANSIGDFVANLAMAKAGKPAMAAVACIAGPLFNLLIGIGASTLLGNCFVESPYPLKPNLQLLVSWGFVVAMLMVILGYAQWNQMQIGKGLGVVLLTMYATSVVVALVIEASHLKIQNLAAD